MEEKVEMLINELKEKINSINDLKSLNDLRQVYMGKKGIITEYQNGIKDADDKKAYGMNLNKLRNAFDELYNAKLNELETLELNKKLENERIDITLPGKEIPVG